MKVNIMADKRVVRGNTYGAHPAVSEIYYFVLLGIIVDVYYHIYTETLFYLILYRIFYVILN